MCRKVLLASCPLLLCAVTAAAQSENNPATNPDDTQLLIEKRVQFVRDAYGLGDQEAERIQAELSRLKDVHEAYVNRYQRTLRRQAKAISLVIPQQKEYDAAMQATLTAKIQDEIYNIHAKDPLSLANAVSKTEAALSPGRVESGRRKIAAKYASHLKGKPLNPKTIDRLIIDPVAPSTEPITRAITPSKVRPGQQANSSQGPKVLPKRDNTDGQAAAAKPQTPPALPGATPPIKQQTPPPQTVTAPPEPLPPLPPAPPTTDWAATMNGAATKYGFSKKQEEVAQQALESCLNRAEAYLKVNQESLDLAKQAAPSDENAKRLTDLRRPIDRLYHELNQRIDSIATVEQVLAAEKAAKQESSGKK
jgi:hypothetical protein